jgi:tight adherence protein B
MAWVAIAAAVLATWAPRPSVARLGTLAEHGRLTSLATHRRHTVRHLPWPRIVAMATVAAAAVVWAAGGVALGAAVVAAGWTAAQLARDLARRRAAAEAGRQLTNAVRVLVGELETGSRPAAALVAAAEVAPRYAPTLHAAAVLASGSGEAATALARDPDTRILGVAWQLGADSGAALAGVLGRVAADLAAAQDQRRAVAVVLAGPRSSAIVLAGLPLLGLGLGTLLGARPWVFLLGSDAGQVVTSVGVLLDLAGLLWMRAILRRAEQSC